MSTHVDTCSVVSIGSLFQKPKNKFSFYHTLFHQPQAIPINMYQNYHYYQEQRILYLKVKDVFAFNYNLFTTSQWVRQDRHFIRCWVRSIGSIFWACKPSNFRMNSCTEWVAEIPTPLSSVITIFWVAEACFFFEAACTPTIPLHCRTPIDFFRLHVIWPSSNLCLVQCKA